MEKRLRGSVRKDAARWGYDRQEGVVEVNEAEKAQGPAMKAALQVAAVKKPLMAVRRIVVKGNRVCFGPLAEDNIPQKG